MNHLLISSFLAQIAVSLLPIASARTEVQLFQSLNLKILRAETNKHRTGIKRPGPAPVPHLYVQVNVVAKRWNGQDIGQEKYYFRTKTHRSGRPVFNQTLTYVKGVSPGFVIGTDTVFRLHVYDAGHTDSGQENPVDDWLGMFEIRLGHEVENDRSNMELMSVMLKPGTEVGSVVWYEYDFSVFQSTAGLWGSDVQENWSGNVEPDADYPNR